MYIAQIRSDLGKILDSFIESADRDSTEWANMTKELNIWPLFLCKIVFLILPVAEIEKQIRIWQLLLHMQNLILLMSSLKLVYAGLYASWRCRTVSCKWKEPTDETDSEAFSIWTKSAPRSSADDPIALILFFVFLNMLSSIKPGAHQLA